MLKDSILRKLETLVERHEEVGMMMTQPEIIGDQNQFRDLSVEYAHLEPIVVSFKDYQQSIENLDSAKEMMKDSDPDMREMGVEEMKESDQQIESLSLTLQKLLLPKDPHDNSNIFLEIRAGAGGDEAAIFAGNLFRMYSRYAEINRWQVEVLSENLGEHGGYREVIARIVGLGAYSKLKFESGAHRVQRVPETESQGRVHTSAATVVVMPEPDEVEKVDVINPSELRVDTYRASGAGGQHVNKTDSAVRLTHLPTGIVVECQDERSQHKNKARAMSLLMARINNIEIEKQEQEQASARKSLVGTGDRSDRIRTYNYPQGRVTEHRINLTLYKLDEVMQGHIEQVLDPLINEYQAEQLASLSETQ